MHHSDRIMAKTETFRIGNLVEDCDKSTEENVEDVQEKEMEDPFEAEPERHPDLFANSLRPYCAEPPGNVLAVSFWKERSSRE